MERQFTRNWLPKFQNSLFDICVMIFLIKKYPTLWVLEKKVRISHYTVLHKQIMYTIISKLVDIIFNLYKECQILGTTPTKPWNTKGVNSLASFNPNHYNDTWVITLQMMQMSSSTSLSAMDEVHFYLDIF